VSRAMSRIRPKVSDSDILICGRIVRQLVVQLAIQLLIAIPGLNSQSGDPWLRNL